MSTHARPLADRLAAASDAELERMLHERRVRADVGWEDFFDAAEALLEPASIERALAALSLDQARALHRAVQGGTAMPDPGVMGAAGLGLLDESGHVLPPVAEVVQTKDEPADAAAQHRVEASADASARAAEQAFTTIGALADLVLAARSAPLALVATGALSATEKRRLGDDGDLDELRELAEVAGLLRAVDRELRVTLAADAWLSDSFPPRWEQAATRLRAALPRSLRGLDVAQWALAHPWNAQWPARAERLRSLARRLGLIADDGTEPSWATPLHTGDEFDSTALRDLLPTEVDRLFLQNDLTAIAPGPLLPALDNRLRAMTEHESSAQASSYRFTTESIARALVEGESEEGILRFLREVSLTGVPQPLHYLVTQTVARHGLVRVAPDAEGGTRVSSGDPHLLAAMEVDRSLRPLGLVREGDELLTRVRPESVTWALTEARYPATLVDARGQGVSAARPQRAEPEGTPATSYADLLGRLRAHRGPDADAAWLDRELEAAVRARAVVVVEVAMPDGSSRELTLEAAGLGGGRLRGLDRAADVERTLPVRSIRSVRVLQS